MVKKDNNKYSKIAKAYVLGEDLIDDLGNEYDIEELEQNEEFMLEVFKYIKKDENYAFDKEKQIEEIKKIYKFSSQNIKDNFEIIKYIIENYNNDINFICDIATNYLKKTVDYEESDDYEEIDWKRFEISVLMRNLGVENNKKNDERFYIFYIHSESKYILKRNTYKEVIKRTRKDEYGRGYMIAYEEYLHSSILQEFMAQRMIRDIFEEFDLEGYIHEKYKTYNEYMNSNKKTLLIELIKAQDESLSWYATTNIKALDESLEKINLTKEQWDLYETKLEEEKTLYASEYLKDQLLKINVYDLGALNNIAIIYYLFKSNNYIELLDDYNYYILRMVIEFNISDEIKYIETLYSKKKLTTDEERIKSIINRLNNEFLHIMNIKSLTKLDAYIDKIEEENNKSNIVEFPKKRNKIR